MQIGERVKQKYCVIILTSDRLVVKIQRNNVYIVLEVYKVDVCGTVSLKNRRLHKRIIIFFLQRTKQADVCLKEMIFIVYEHQMVNGVLVSVS